MPMSMNVSFKHLKYDRIVRRSFFVSLTLIIITFFYIIFSYSYLPPYIPIYNQLPWGLNRLGEKFMVLLPLIITTVLLLINIIYAQFIYEKMPLIVRMLSVTTMLISLLTLIFTIRMTLLII